MRLGRRRLANSEVRLDPTNNFFRRVDRMGQRDPVVSFEPLGDFAFGGDRRTVAPSTKILTDFGKG